MVRIAAFVGAAAATLQAADAACAISLLTGIDSNNFHATEPCVKTGDTAITSVNAASTCKVACKSGFKPSAADLALTCTEGPKADGTDDTFTDAAAGNCVAEAACTVADFTTTNGFAAAPCGADAGATIASTQSCTVACGDNKFPSAETALCTDGTWASVTCEAGAQCDAADLAAMTTDLGFAAAPCGADVTTIDSGSSCTVACADPKVPSAETALCTNGALAAVTCADPTTTTTTVVTTTTTTNETAAATTTTTKKDDDSSSSEALRTAAALAIGASTMVLLA